MKKTKLLLEVLRLPVDYIATFGALILAYKLRSVTDLIPGVHFTVGPEQLPPFLEYLQFSFISAAFLLVLFAFNALYSLKSNEFFSKAILKIVFLVSAWLLFIIAYYFLIVHELFFSRIALAHIWFFSIVFIIVGRLLILLVENLFYRFGYGKTRLLFVGVNEFVDASYRILKRDPKYEIIGALSEQLHSRKRGQLKIVGELKDLESVFHKHRVDAIIQAQAQLKGLDSETLVAFCRANHIEYYFIPEVLKIQSMNVTMEMIDNIPFIRLKQTRLEGWGRVYKRLFDFFAALILVILLIPVWIVIPLLIKLDSKGPVFYASKRKYRNKVFSLYKFRSMVDGAEKQRAELLSQNERSGPLFKIKDDPRVTPLGRILRKTSIDELPQLFNVLLGHISLVGPRPHLPEEVEQYEAHHLGVFAIKPGITGLAQINGRSNLDFEDELKFDFYYIENWSLWLDLKILIQTVGVVFRADGH